MIIVLDGVIEPNHLLYKQYLQVRFPFNYLKELTQFADKSLISKVILPVTIHFPLPICGFSLLRQYR